MNEDCKTIREELALTGGEAESESAREHVFSCSDCTRFAEALGKVEFELKALSGHDVSDEVVAKLLARKELGVNPRRTRWRVPAAALATAASVVLAVSLLLNRGHESFEREGDELDYREPNKNEESPPPRLEPEDEDRFDAAAGVSPPSPPSAGVFAPEDKRQDLSKEKLAQLEGELQEEKKDSLLDAGRFAARRPIPTGHRDPVYPDAARSARVQGTVILEVTVDRQGNVTDARVVESIPLLDQAAVEAVREWKYEPLETDAPRVFRVPVTFQLPSPDGEGLSLLEERAQVDGLRFVEPRGYWANTYLPGDPMRRRLERRPERTMGAIPALHETARPASLPFDPSSTSALSLFVHADRSGITSKSRLLVQVGIRASDHHGRRRPPMNVGVVLHLPENVSLSDASAVTSLVQSLASSREAGDRFRVITTGAGAKEIPPEEFSYGPLSVRLREWLEEPASSSPSLFEALASTLARVHAGDDPAMPLGTSVVLVVSGRSLDSELDRLLHMVQESAVGGVSVSAVGFGPASGEASLEKLALSGQGRRYDLGRAEDAPGVVDRELTSASRAVARALRLRIQLAEGVRLVGVLGSEPLSARAAARVRAEERSIDLRLSRNLGIEADRGRDEDGIQIVIPTFYAGDAHSILLDVVADGPGPIAEVTARYKDLVQLDNTVARANLSLPRSETAPGPLEATVAKDYLGFRVSEALRAAAESLDQGDPARSIRCLEAVRSLLARVGPSDSDLRRDVALLDGYLEWVPRFSAPRERDYLVSSLLYASSLKRLSPTTAS
jgi:TonB family protein